MVRKSVIVRRCLQCGLSDHNFKTYSKKNNSNNATIAIANSNNYNTLSISTGTYNNSTGIATANTNNARCIKIFGVYFRNVDGLDLNKSVSIENRCTKNVENEVKIDAERKKGIIFKFALYLHIYISVVLYVLCVYGICLF